MKNYDVTMQNNFGRVVYKYTPTKSEIDFAENTVKNCTKLPMYAKIDVFTDNNGTLALIKLEVINPELWFRIYPDTTNELAKGIKQLINLV